MKVTKEMIENAAVLNRLIELRNIKNTTLSKKDKIAYDNYFNVVFKRFSYIVDIHTNKYKKYANYQDLKQEGSMGLFIALNNFNPARSKNLFRVIHWYVSTRIQRSAHKHDLVRLTLKQSKDNNHLNRVDAMPIIIDESKNPYEYLESSVINKEVINAVSNLLPLEKTIVSLYFGIDSNKKTNITNICNQTKMPRVKVLEILQSACKTLGENLNNFNI
jgi:RNA polymerase sigma factor (sigma-70 family)